MKVNVKPEQPKMRRCMVCDGWGNDPMPCEPDEPCEECGGTGYVTLDAYMKWANADLCGVPHTPTTPEGGKE